MKRYDTLKMDFVEVKEYSIKDVLRAENEGREFRMLNNPDTIRVQLTFDSIPVAHIVVDDENGDLIEDVYTLTEIVNAKFVEVN